MDLSSLWVMLSAALVFFMQAGFLCLESGLVRERNAEVVALKNFVDWVLTNLIFFVVGFGLMFGPSVGGILGGGFFAGIGLSGTTGPIASNEIFFLFQLAFAGTAATIVSGAIAGRASFVAYLGATAAMACVVYPVFGHWAWGNLFLADNEPWLASLGFRDFAGSTVVHSTGAWFALVAAWKIGPRQGRFDALGHVRPIPGHSLQLATLGCVLLWVGWWGFNGGSTLAFNEQVGPIVLVTNLAGAAGGLSAMLHGWKMQGARDLAPKVLGGALGGLVSITASCDVATPLAAIAIGAVGGIVHNIALEALLSKGRVDDPVGAVAVHGACGVWGTLVVALVVPTDELGEGGRLVQFWAQLLGVLACALWASGIAFAVFSLIERTIGLRLSPELERSGVDIAGRQPVQPAPLDAEGELALDPEVLRALLRGDAR